MISSEKSGLGNGTRGKKVFFFFAMALFGGGEGGGGDQWEVSHVHGDIHTTRCRASREFRSLSPVAPMRKCGFFFLFILPPRPSQSVVRVAVGAIAKVSERLRCLWDAGYDGVGSLNLLNLMSLLNLLYIFR